MNRIRSYEINLDTSVFYTQEELLNRDIPIYENTLYFKSGINYKRFFDNKENLYEYCLKQKGVYLFILDCLENKQLSYICFKYENENIFVEKSELFAFCEYYSKKENENLILERIAVISSYNNYLESDLIKEIKDDNEYNKLLYVSSENELVDYLNKLKKLEIIDKYKLPIELYKRIENLCNKCSYDLKVSHELILKYVINDGFLNYLNESMLKTFTNVEKSLFYYLKLIPLVDNSEINVTQKNIFEINQKSKISIEQFITIFCTLLKNLKIAYNFVDSKTLYLKKYDITFTINNELDENSVTINDNNLYLKVKEYLENTKKQQHEFKNNVELYNNKINLSDINKIHLLIKLLTRKSTIQNYRYQRKVFNIFYPNNDHYKIEFYRKKNDINYNFYTLIKLKDRNLFIDLNSITKVNPIRIISTDELTSYEKIYI